ncbi:MAG: hypothetical protein KGR26_11820, partial [Cyanobacteria bacterium REEB65]|nr:hypothetical protein [Cyanobacteria bacterium REEB65]
AALLHDAHAAGVRVSLTRTGIGVYDLFGNPIVGPWQKRISDRGADTRAYLLEYGALRPVPPYRDT